MPEDWRLEPKPKKDFGKRPSLDSLGPFRWQPYSAPDWKLADEHGKDVSLTSCKGQPVLLVFYLGRGCPHCVQQLNLLSKAAKDFEAQGIRILAIGSDSAKAPAETSLAVEDDVPFPILSDKSLRTFKAYRAYDDFEQMPLHATFLVDGAGKVRWQDISFQPFTDTKFVIGEAKRLLGQLGQNSAIAAQNSSATTMPKSGTD